MPFVLLSGEKWIKNNGSNFYIAFDSGKKQTQKVRILDTAIDIPHNLFSSCHLATFKF